MSVSSELHNVARWLVLGYLLPYVRERYHGAVKCCSMCALNIQIKL